MSEMMDEAFEDMNDVEEDEVDEEVSKVMTELTAGILDTKVGAGGKASAANRARAQVQEEDAGEEEQMSDMERRLAALG